MLNSNSLAKEFKEMFDDVISNAVYTCMKSQLVQKNKEAEEQLKDFADMLGEMIAKPLSDRMAASIDHYIKSACISGTIITAGSPVTQTAVIVPGMPCGMATAGKVPNTLGIM